MIKQMKIKKIKILFKIMIAKKTKIIKIKKIIILSK
jgi:hypothetical protein